MGILVDTGRNGQKNARREDYGYFAVGNLPVRTQKVTNCKISNIQWNPQISRLKMLPSSQEHRFRVKDISLLALPRVIAEQYIPGEKALRISISDPGNRASLPEDDNIIDTLYLEFHDKIRPREGVLLFSEKQALSIYEFIEKYEDYSEIIIHCAAGMSRSPAIAWALAEYFGSTTAETFYTTKYWPNQHVYTLMHGLRTDGSS